MLTQATLRDPSVDPFWLWSDVLKQSSRLIDLMQSPTLKEDPESAFQQLNSIVLLIEFLTEQDTDVGIFALMQCDMSSYVVAHHVQTVFLSGMIANNLGMTVAKRRSLCRAAFTMNITALSLQRTLSRQRGPLLETQRADMTGHGLRGAALLKDLGVTDGEWLRAVAEHHPEIYPADHCFAELPTILHHADIYLAKISPRSYRRGKSPDVAAKELLVDSKSDRRIVQLLIKVFGVYPPGSYVRLANKEIAVVVRRSEKAHTPIVYSISANDQPLPNPIRRDTSEREFSISGVVPKESINFSINHAHLLGYHHV